MNSGHDTMLTLATLVILPSGTRLYVIECSMTQMNLRRAQTENAAAPTTRGFARSFTEGNIKGGLGAVGKFALESNQGESEAMRNSSNINMVWYHHHTILWYGTTIPAHTYPHAFLRRQSRTCPCVRRDREERN